MCRDLGVIELAYRPKSVLIVFVLYHPKVAPAREKDQVYARLVACHVFGERATEANPSVVQLSIAS